MRAASHLPTCASSTSARSFPSLPFLNSPYLALTFSCQVWPDEREAIPQEEEAPSADFMAQLREFSAPFRYSPEVVAINHLGVK